MNYRYMVWCGINLGSGTPQIRVPVLSPVAGAEVIRAMAEEQVHRPDIESNVFGLLELDGDGEWSEWYGPDGSGIDELIDQLDMLTGYADCGPVIR